MSINAAVPEIAIFQPVPKEKSVEKIYWVEQRPTSQISDKGPIEFVIAGTSPDYVCLDKTYLHTKVKITNADGSDLVAPSGIPENVGMVNLSQSSLFRQVDVTLNQQIINPSVGTNYAYKSYIDVLLNYNHSVKEGQLQAEGFYKDAAFSFDRYGNTGHTKRMEWTRESRIHDMEGLLHVDLAQQHRAIPNGVEIGVKLFQASDEFRIFSGQTIAVPPPDGSPEGTPPSEAPYTDYKLTIVEATLKVAYMKLTPSVLLGHNNGFKIAPAIYPYWKSVVKTFGIPKGNRSFTIENPHNGHKPTSFVVGFVKSSAHSGSMLTSPFNFQHFFLNFLEFTVDGVSVPGAPLQPQYTYNPSETNPPKTYLNGYVSEYKRLFGGDYPQKDGNFIHLGNNNQSLVKYLVHKHS